PLAVAGRRRLWQACPDVALVVGGDALQAADRDRLRLDAAAAAGGLARPVASPPEDSREDVRIPVDHVGVAIPPGGDQPDVFGDRRVRGESPLTIAHLMEKIGIAD